MHSIKNTVVSIILLGVTYTVYQSITTPEPMDDAAASLYLNVDDNLESMSSQASKLIGDATGTMKGMANRLGQKARGIAKQTRDAAEQFNNKASRIPDSLLNDPPQLPKFSNDSFASNGFPNNSFPNNGFPNPNADQNQQGSGSLASALPKAPPLIQNGSGNRDQELINNLKSAIGQGSAGSGTSSPAPRDNSFAANLSPSPTFPPQPGMTNVKPRPDNSDFGFGNGSDANVILDTNVQPVSTATRTLESAWPKINSMVRNRQFSTALTELTSYYNSSVYGSDEKLLKWLDLLAAKVIYSPENHLRDRPYVVQPGDKIADLARRWKIPAQLIYNTNREKITDPNNMPPGTELKIIQGPFDAVVDSKNGLMTLFLQGMYAGRFSVSGASAIPQGEFRIVDKSVAKKAGMPHWINLSNGTNIFGTDQRVTGSDVGLNPGDAADVFAILSAASKVRVLR